MYGAELITALKRRDPSLEFFGVGGPRMRAAGCETVVDAKDLAVVGITEILSHLRKIYALFDRLIAEADRRKPDLAIVIDSPAFNWRRGATNAQARYPGRLLRLPPVLGMAAASRKAASQIHQESTGNLSVRREVLSGSRRERHVCRTSARRPSRSSHRARRICRSDTSSIRQSTGSRSCPAAA